MWIKSDFLEFGPSDSGSPYPWGGHSGGSTPPGPTRQQLTNFKDKSDDLYAPAITTANQTICSTAPAFASLKFMID